MIRGRGLSLLLAVLVGSPIGAFAAAGTESASFLDIPVGAGPAALGGAYTALANDLYAPVWNPAGLAFLDSTQVGGEHLSYLESIHYEHLGFVTPFKNGSGLGLSAQYLGSGDIAGSNFDGSVQSNYSSYYGSYNLAYGKTLGENLSLGLTGKVINAKIADVTSTAYAGDLGALYKVSEKATIAATVDNLGTKLKFLNDNSSLPMAGHLAAAYAPNSHWLGSIEGVYPKSGSAGAHVGIEWKPIDLLAIRAGYKTETTKELGAMAGMSVGAGVKVWGQELAYAWVPYGDLGDTQYFSLVMHFGAAEKAKQNFMHAEDIRQHGTTAKIESNETQQLYELLTSGEEHTAKKQNSTPIGQMQ